jgi:hypothetical protein
MGAKLIIMGGGADWLELGIHPEIGALYLPERTAFGRVK